MQNKQPQVKSVSEIVRRLANFHPGMYNPLMRISTPEDATRYLNIEDSHAARDLLVQDGFWIPEIFEGHPIVSNHMVYALDPNSGLYIARLFRPSAEPLTGELANIVDIYLFEGNVFPRAAVTSPDQLKCLMAVLTPYKSAGMLATEAVEKQKGAGVLQYCGP